MTFEEKTISTERIYEGRILNLRVDKVTTVNGTSYREIIEHGGAVAIAAITDEGKMLMVRQFRKPLEKVVLEVPAGKIDPGEDDPAETAGRELREETGYSAKDVSLLTSFYPTVAYCEEVIHLYLCTGLTPGETDFDESEAIDLEEFEIDSLYDMVMAGKIDDGKTNIAVLMVKALVAEGRLPQCIR